MEAIEPCSQKHMQTAIQSLCLTTAHSIPLSPYLTCSALHLLTECCGRCVTRGKAVWDQLFSVSYCKARNEREWKRVRRKRGRWRTYGIWGPSFLPLPSSPLFPLISHTWDHSSLWNQHPTKTLLSLISSLSSSPIHMLSSLRHLFSLCLFSNILHLF